MATDSDKSHQDLAAPNTNIDCFVVDEESRSPEGSAYAVSQIYVRSGDEYKSTRKSIPASLVEQIRRCVMESESKQSPDVSQFGVTPESVRQKVNEYLKKHALASSDPKKHPHPTFDELDPAVRKMFEYDTVSKAALELLSQPFNSGYMIVHVFISGDQPIDLQSRHQAGGMVPWSVKVGNKAWRTYSAELPKLLAQFGENGYLAGRQANWFDDFFFKYSADYDRSDQLRSIRDREAAKHIVGWEEASKLVTIEDAIIYNDGAAYIQVKMKDPGCAIDRIRWTAGKKNDADKLIIQDWNQFLVASDKLERAAREVGWLRRWRQQSPERSLVGMLTDSGNLTYRMTEETNGAITLEMFLSASHINNRSQQPWEPKRQLRSIIRELVQLRRCALTTTEALHSTNACGAWSIRPEQL